MGYYFALWRNIETHPREGSDQILLVAPWRGRYVYTLYSRNFSFTTIFFVLLRIMVIYHILPCTQFQGNAKVNKLGIGNYALKLRSGGKSSLMDMLILTLREKEFKRCLLWQSLIYEGRWEPLHGKLRKFALT